MKTTNLARLFWGDMGEMKRRKDPAVGNMKEHGEGGTSTPVKRKYSS
jgi:hypothetical protein